MSIPFTNTEYWGGGIYSHFRLTAWLNIEPFYALKTEGSADYINTQSINRNWLGFRIVNPEKQSIIYDLIYTRELSLRYTYATGGKKSDTSIHTFDPAYGAQDKFYGWMNLVQWSNQSDPVIVLELFPFKKKMWIELNKI